MFRSFVVLLTSVILIGCTQGYSQKYNSGSKILDYKNKQDEYTVVVIQDEISKEEAKKKALKRAAKLSYDNGYRYFIIEDEDEVQVMLGKEGWPSSYDFPQNLYQEEIVEKGYNRERFIQGSKEDYNLYPALKIDIKCLSKPEKGAYNVCNFIKCR